jgi:hypothetical protein
MWTCARFRKRIEMLPETKRRRWNLAEHRKCIERVYRKQVFPANDKSLKAARRDRKLIQFKRGIEGLVQN